MFKLQGRNNPKFQGYEICLSTMAALKDIGVHGVKHATFNMLTFATWMRQLAVYAKASIRGIVNAHPRAPFLSALKQKDAAIRGELEALGVL